MIRTVFFALLMSVISIPAQNSVYETDVQKRKELIRALEVADVSEQAVIYSKIAESYVYVDTNKTLDYAKLAIEKAAMVAFNQLKTVEPSNNIRQENETRQALLATNTAQRWAILMAALLIIGVIILLIQLSLHNRSLRKLQQQEHDFAEQLKAKHDAILSRNKDLAEIIAHRDRLYSIIAHDLKSPIGALHGLMQTLTSEDLQKEETVSILRSLAPSVKSTYELVEQLVEWAQTQQMELNPRPEVINLFQVFQSAMDQMAPFLTMKNITLTSRIAVNHEVFFDRGMLLSILRSLLSNAVKFTNQDGSIDIQSLPDLSGVSFKNSGRRIPQPVIDAVNTNQTVESSFGTAGEKGTGLGLSIIKTLLEANGGSIEFKADSTTSEAIVYLPKPEKN